MRETVIATLTKVSNKEYKNTGNLIEIYDVIINFDTYIKENVSKELYDKLKLETDTVDKEYMFGDGDEYSEYVYNDCVEALKDVIAAL